LKRTCRNQLLPLSLCRNPKKKELEPSTRERKGRRK
jgi:hypothetical protein